MIKHLCIFFFLLLPAFGFGQDKVLFTNGKEKEVTVVKIDEYSIVYHKPNKKNEKKFRKENVFSITYLDGKEEIIYNPDTLGFLVTDVVEPEVDYTVEEMRRYIAGAQDGRKVKKTAALLTSAGISTVGSGLGAFFGPIAPATYIIVLGTTRQKPDETKVAHPEYILDEAYLAGYSKAARKRKIIAAAEGGLIGLAVGIPVYWAVFRGF
jgi:hypothetical protein